MNKRILVNGVLYEAVDLRLKPPRYMYIDNGETELFYDESVGCIKTTRSHSNGYDSRSVHFSRVVYGDLVANFVSVRIELPDKVDNDNPFRGIEVSLDGKDYIINNLDYELTDHDLQLTFDNIVSDIYHKMELSSEDVFVDTVKISARRAISHYGLVKWVW